MGITVTLRGGSGDMLKTTYDPDLDGVVALAQTEADMTKAVYDSDENGKIVESIFDYGVWPKTNGRVVRKVASNDLRHSIDAAIENSSGLTWRKDKTLVFTEGIKGVIRVKFDLKNQPGTGCGKLTDKDGTLLGAAQDAADCSTYQTKSQDITVDFAPDGELQLWSRDAGCSTWVQNMRVYYLNDSTSTPDIVAVTGAD